MSTHATLSPSSASRWMACPGSVALSVGIVDRSSSYADEGTDAHELAARCLQTGTDATAYLGETMPLGNSVSLEMATAVQAYLDYVRDVVASTGGALLIEQRLPIDHITGEAGAHGTSDAVVLTDDELIVIDLKFGRGVVVEAENNDQLQIYALAALREFEALGDFQHARVVIHQPRLNAVSEWAQPVEQLRAFGDQVRIAAAATRAADAPLAAGEKQCKFCKEKGTCPALAAQVQEAIGSDFENLTTFDRGMTAAHLQKHEHRSPDQLGASLAAVDLVELWCKAVRAEVETRLLAGQPIPGWKLVQGKKGNRAWSSKEEAEAALKAMRIKHDQMYDYTVISPTTAEKLAKAEVIGPRQWPKLQALITQTEGKPSVAPEADKRPALAIAAAADDFHDVSSPADLAETCDLA